MNTVKVQNVEVICFKVISIKKFKNAFNFSPIHGSSQFEIYFIMQGLLTFLWHGILR